MNSKAKSEIQSIDPKNIAKSLLSQKGIYPQRYKLVRATERSKALKLINYGSDQILRG
jgi:hypothetical protein